MQAILDDDDYRRIRVDDVVAGDIVVYHAGGEVTHTGIVMEMSRGDRDVGLLRSISVMSKWGPAAEYLHQVKNCPWGEDDVEYRTDRPA